MSESPLWKWLVVTLLIAFCFMIFMAFPIYVCYTYHWSLFGVSWWSCYLKVQVIWFIIVIIGIALLGDVE